MTAVLSPTFWDRISNPLVAIGLALVTYYATWFANWLHFRRAKLKSERNTISHAYRYDLQINFILYNTLLRFPTAMRAYLTKFHNGQRYADRTEMIRTSRTHEVLNPGFSPQQHLYQGELMSNMREEMELVVEEGATFVTVDKLKPSKFKWMCEQSGTKAVVRVCVQVRGVTIGFVGADFDTPEKPANLDQICEDAYAIGQLLSEYIK